MPNNSDAKLQTRLANDEEYDFCNVETGQQFTVKWTPPSQSMKFLTRKYPSPRQISKSTIRKSVRAFTRQRINKSLNFEPSGRTDRFKTPGSGGLDQFSRSAKIMRALNFNSNSCPGTDTQRMSVTKVLNFDVSPSPKTMQSPASNFSASSPIDSIHLSISSSDSHSTSIDENQNRTPSNPRKSAKKSLNYSSPNLNNSLNSPSVTISPLLRSGLKEKIDGIVEISETPNMHSLKRISNKAIANDIVNTSRNLYFDFERECSDSSPCPSTPKNTCKPIPESMSAIKKSHRKERLSRRFEDKKARRTTEDDDEDDGMHLLEPEDLLTSPIIQHLTPKNRVTTVIESPEHEDEDNLSETGSLFSYSRNKENMDEPVPLDELNLPEVKEPDEEVSFTEPMPKSPAKQEQNYLETPKSNKSKSVLKVPNANALSPSKKLPNLNILLPACSTPLVSKKTINAHTPENDPSVVPDIISSSIKKSHKKVKEEHRKRLMKPTALHTALLNSSRDLRQRVETVDQELEDRPTTPENLNSSRLLLPQFDSVKKSHKKEKQTKKLQGYSRRSMLVEQDGAASAKSLGDVSMSLKSQLDESAERVGRKKSDSFSEIVPIDDVSELVSSPVKKMKTPEGEMVIKRAVENESNFEIFTPIRKRRTQLIPADENHGANALVTETVDDGFITPVKGKLVPKVTVEDSTPEDRLSTADLVKDIEHSIKKSHRKDKQGAKKLNRLNRSLNMSFDNSLKISEPLPSTSKATTDEVPMITPPNCLKSKTYLHLLQNSSIKKSHKKERAKRKSIAELNRSLNSYIVTRSQSIDKEALNMEDAVLSDDGTIFSEEDRLSFLETEGAINVDQDKGENEDVQENSAVDPALNEEENNPDLDQSYQGSIFDDSERLQSMEEEGI